MPFAKSSGIQIIMVNIKMQVIGKFFIVIHLQLRSYNHVVFFVKNKKILFDILFHFWEGLPSLGSNTVQTLLF